MKTSENKLFIADSRCQLACHWWRLGPPRPPQLWDLEPSRTERAPRAEPPRPCLKVPPIMISGFFLPRVGIFLAPVGFQMRPNLFSIISLAALNIKGESEDESASLKESCVEIIPCGSHRPVPEWSRWPPHIPSRNWMCQMDNWCISSCKSSST